MSNALVKSKAGSMASLLKRFTAVIVLAGFLVLGFVVVATGPSAEPLPRSERAWPVSVVRASPAQLSPILITFGKVESKQVANLNTSISAPVEQVLVYEGASVEKGQLLIQLDAVEAQLALSIAQANFDRSVAALHSVRTQQDLAQNLQGHYEELSTITDSKLSRAQDLNAKQMISDAALDDARQAASEGNITLQRHLASVADFPSKVLQQQATVDETAAYLRKAELDLEQTQIRAPFSGRVIKNSVARGDRVMIGATLIQIADYAGLEVRVSVPSQTASLMTQSLQQGQIITATAEHNGQHFNFELERLSADIKPGQSGIDVFFVDSLNRAIDIGAVMSLSIKLPAQKDVISMPVHALYQNQTLFKLTDNRLEAVHYETVGDYVDEEGNYTVLVRSTSVSAGDSLMVSQLPRAITGLLVEPVTTAELDVERN